MEDELNEVTDIYQGKQEEEKEQKISRFHKIRPYLTLLNVSEFLIIVFTITLYPK